MQFRRAVQLLRSGRPLEAIPLLHDAMRLDPRFFEAHHALGSALLQTGRLAEASAAFLQALKLRPDSAAAWRDIAASYDRQNAHEPAIEAYKNALQLAPQLSDVLLRLAQLYTMYSRMDDASDCFERAADIKPDTIQARLYRSDARLLRGDISGAEGWAREAVALDPESSPAHGTLAGLLYAQGRFDEAAMSFEQALRLNPKEGRCWLGLADCRTYTAADNSILDRMHAILQSGDLSGFDRMAMHFASGKICDNRGDYARAMEHFDAANALRARDLNFDRERFEAMVDQTIRRYTRDFIVASARSGTPDTRPLFVVGMYRSGTTLVEQILSGHPEIAAGGELTVWTPADIEVEPATGEFHPDRSRAAVAKYLSVLQKIGPSAARVTDKLPFNCFRLGAIHALLPNARIVHCRRDPIDTCLSIYSNLLKSRVAFAARKADLAFCYRQYQRLMEHWRNVLPADVFLEIEYERLIADREAETRRLIAFTGLGWNDSCLRPDENKRAINTASAWQARQPMYTTSIERWRHYEPWLGELRELLSPEIQGERR
ncbi:MAG TPA: sulfotransferase [Rhizomicrobium sp.]|nr:sulfotransferase [Rhizomicrobium sp.]